MLAGCFEFGYALCVGGSEGFTVLSWSLVAVGFFLLTLFALGIPLRTMKSASATPSGLASASSERQSDGRGL